MIDDPLPGKYMTYLEALCSAEGKDVLLFDGEYASSACAHCVRDPRYSRMVQLQVRGTSFVLVTPLHNLPDGLLCSACLKPFHQHWSLFDAPPTP